MATQAWLWFKSQHVCIIYDFMTVRQCSNGLGVIGPVVKAFCHEYTHAHTHKRTHIHMQNRTHTHTHTHTETGHMLFSLMVQEQYCRKLWFIMMYGIYKFQPVYLVVAYLAEIGIEFSHRITEFLNILCQQLVSISNAIVKVTHFVECEAPVEKMKHSIYRRGVS